MRRPFARLPANRDGATLDAPPAKGLMPQHYMIGEFSLLLAELETICGERPAAVHRLRHQVEHYTLPSLPHLALEASELTDRMCWAALEKGDISGFHRCVSTAVAVRDFTAAAGLLPNPAA